MNNKKKLIFNKIIDSFTFFLKIIVKLFQYQK